jgi:hypothetical protein
MAALSMAALPWLGSCSLVIDVDADCTDSACGAYRCDEDGIACLDSCSAAADCSNGYECAGGRCTRVTCVPAMQPRVLALPPSIDEVVASYADRPDPTDQLFVLVSNRDGLGFRRFFPNGDVVPDPPLPEESILVPLVDDNEARRSFSPTVAVFDEAESAAASPDPRFQYAFANVRDPRVVLQRGQLVIFPPRAPQTFDLLRGSSASDEFAQVSLAASESASVVAYRREGTLPTVQAMVSTFDGSTPITLEPVVLSAEGEEGGAVAAGPAGESLAVAWSGTLSGQERVRLALLDASGAVEGTAVIYGPENAFTVDVRRVLIAGNGTSLAVFWTLSSQSVTQLWGIFLNETDLQAVRVGTPITAQAEQLDISVGSVLDARLYARPGEIGLGVAVANGVNQSLWLYRYDYSGGLILRPVELAEARLGVSPQYSITDHADGYSAVWRQDGGVDEADLVYFQRFICEGAR